VTVVAATAVDSRRDRTGRRALAVSGILGPLLFWGTVLLLGTLDPDYSHVDHAMSLVGSVQAPFSPFARVAFVLTGLLIVAFSVGLYRDLRPGRAGVAGAATIAVHGIGRIGEGVFAWDIERIDSLTNALHTLFGVPALLSMLVAPVLLAWAFRGADGWRPYYRYTVATAVVFAGVFVTIGPFSPPGGPAVPSGLGQRIGFVIWYAWVVVLGVGLYRRTTAPDR
jgi:hypothetical membrane protein